MRFFLISQGSLNPKIRFLGQKVCPVAREQTDMKVTTVGTLSWFQEFFLQPIIKDRPKKKKKKLLPRARFEPTWSNNPGLTQRCLTTSVDMTSNYFSTMAELERQVF